MRIFVAGGTGAIGRPLLERLRAEGHEAAVMTRSPERAAELRARGFDATVADAFDAEAVRAAVAAARPEVVIHQLTALPARMTPRRYREGLKRTNRLRRDTIGTFAGAARDAGARRLIAQSVAFVLRPEGGWVKDETAPLWVDAPDPFRDAVRALEVLEGTTIGTPGLEGVVLRYGLFYGPGTALARDGHYAGEARRRRLPVVGDGAGRASFVYIEDAAAATVLALDRGAPGIYNVTDDEPVPAREWIPAMAAAVGAPRPMRVPLWLGRLVGGPMAEALVSARGASNAKARAELGFRPRYPTYREGFAAVLGASSAAGSSSATGSSSAAASGPSASAGGA
jgi:nucleoside-diphosphate-sugar epimerase